MELGCFESVFEFGHYILLLSIHQATAVPGQPTSTIESVVNLDVQGFVDTMSPAKSIAKHLVASHPLNVPLVASTRLTQNQLVQDNQSIHHYQRHYFTIVSACRTLSQIVPELTSHQRPHTGNQVDNLGLYALSLLRNSKTRVMRARRQVYARQESIF